MSHGSVRFAYPFQNLRLYLSDTRLPPMELAPGTPPVLRDSLVPPEDFLLSCEADSRRKLRTILFINRSLMRKRILDFLQASVPGSQLPSRGLRFPLSSPSFFFSSFLKPDPVAEMAQMYSWVKLPLESLRSAMKLVWPEQSGKYGFTGDLENTSDDAIYRVCYWEQMHNVDMDDVNQTTCKVTIALMAPWALSPLDLDCFVLIGQLPAFSIVQGSDTKLCDAPRFERIHKVWAKLWDDCTRKRCPFFILTVYDAWIFGVFTRGWTMALVSEPIKRTDKRPTVMQWLVFWFASSMGFPGGWKPPILRRFGNPDITDTSRVSEKISPVWTGEDIAPHSEWLEKNHRSLKTVEPRPHSSLVNTWETSFGYQGS